MRGLQVVVGFTLMIAICGCQANPAARREIALLKAEILDLEDQYYRLKSEFRTATGQEPASHQAFRQRGGVSSNDPMACDDIVIDDSPTGYSSSPATGELPWNAPATQEGSSPPKGSSILDVEKRNREELNRLDQNMEEIDLQSPQNNDGSESPRTPSAEQWQRRNRQSRGASGSGNVDGKIATVGFESPLTDRSASQRGLAHIASINVASNITGGFDRDGIDGDEGLYVFVQALDATGQSILAPGEIWISLLDPQLAPTQQRIGFWKLTESDIAQSNRQFSDEKPGVDFYLPWDATKPTHEELLLFVRWIDEQGQYLETQLPVRCRLAKTDSTPSKSNAAARETLESSSELWRPER